MTEKPKKPHDTPEAQLRRRAARIAAGKCLECQEPATPGMTQCEKHRANRRKKENSFPSHTPEHMKEVLARKRAEGICYDCSRPVVPGKRRCLIHRTANPIKKARQLAYSRAYYQKNKKEIGAKNGEYRRTHPEVTAVSDAKRRALKKGSTLNDFTATQWKAMQEAFDHRCAYCNKRCKGRLTQDHITPISQGGAHTAFNIVPACGSCNSRKHDGPVLSPVQPLLLIC